MVGRQKESATTRWKKRREKYPLIDIGGGPYAVKNDCPADRHNSLSAYRGQRTVDNKLVRVAKCICVYSKWLASKECEAKKVRQKAVKKYEEALATQAAKESTTGKFRSHVFMNSIANSVPDLRGAACDNDVGRALVDQIMKDGQGMRELALLCHVCPVAVRRRCENWVVRGEKVPGEWKLVYGGMGPGERTLRAAGHRTGERRNVA